MKLSNKCFFRYLSNSSKKMIDFSCRFRASPKRFRMNFSDSPWYLERTSEGDTQYSVTLASAAVALLHIKLRNDSKMSFGKAINNIVIQIVHLSQHSLSITRWTIQQNIS